MSILFLQKNPKEKMMRLQQLLDWGYIDDKEADLMYKQYCLLFGEITNENTKTRKQFERKGDVGSSENLLVDRSNKGQKSYD